MATWQLAQSEFDKENVARWRKAKRPKGKSFDDEKFLMILAGLEVRAVACQAREPGFNSGFNQMFSLSMSKVGTAKKLIVPN